MLEYFALSKFYDRRSCNEELRMQGVKDIRLEHVEGLRGVQYLAEEVPGHSPEEPIFVVQKLLRSAKEQTQILDVYYVLSGMVYQAPTIFSVLNARLRRCASMLNKAQKTLNRAISFDYNAQGGGGGGGSEMYQVRRKEGKSSKRARAAAAAAAAAHHPPPPHPFYGYGYPPPPHIHEGEPGEPIVMVEGHPHHHHYPLPPMMMPPPPPPHHHMHAEPPPLSPGGKRGDEEAPRFASRYPGPSPLAGHMAHAHPSGPGAVDRAIGALRAEEVTAGGPSGTKDV